MNMNRPKTTDTNARLMSAFEQIRQAMNEIECCAGQCPYVIVEFQDKSAAVSIASSMFHFDFDPNNPNGMPTPFLGLIIREGQRR